MEVWILRPGKEIGPLNGCTVPGKDLRLSEENGYKTHDQISGYDVFVTALYLPPEVFNTAPVFFLSTVIPENDYLAKNNLSQNIRFQSGD